MSQVKFERKEDVRITNNGGGSGGPRGGRGPPPPPPPPAAPHKEGLLHEAGEALTKGAGPNGYLAVGQIHC